MDEAAALAAERIFTLCMEGRGLSQIRKSLTRFRKSGSSATQDKNGQASVSMTLWD